MRRPVKIGLIAPAAIAPATAFAHPGAHRLESVWSLLHAFSNIDHLLVLGAGFAALAAVAILLERNSGGIVAARLKAR
jgi:hypothetical protein